MNSPKAPKPLPPPAPPPAPPTIDDARGATEERDRLRKRRGRAATLLAGDGPAPKTAAKQLLGE